MKNNKLLKKKKNVKRVLAILLIGILIIITELLFNWQAIRRGYNDIELMPTMEVIEVNGNEKYILTYENANWIYVNKVKIQACFENMDGYVVQTEEINGFGKEAEQYYEDIINSDFNQFETIINKRIKYIKITIPKPENSKVYSVRITNSFEWNKYRMLFCCVIFILLYMVFFEKYTLEHIEWYAVTAILLLGGILIVFGQVGCNSWDEAFHFNKAYSIAGGKSIEWNEAAFDVINKSLPSCNTKAEFAELRQYINQKETSILYTEKANSNGITYSTIAYVPMALFIKMAMLLKLPFTKTFMLGKLGNLLFYAFIMFWAIKEAKYKKVFLAFIAILPTCLFLASSYTYDSVVFACVTLGCVLWSNESFSNVTRYNVSKISIAIVCFSVGCLSKAIYIPVILLMLLLPQLKTLNKKHAIIWCMGILLICLLVMVTFVLPIISNTVSGNLSYGGDSRGGDTGTIRQLVSMIKHPIESIKLMLYSVTKLDNFRNLGTVEFDNFFFGNLMFLNFASFGVLPDKWAALLVVIFITTLLYENQEEKMLIRYDRWKRGTIIFIGIVTVFLIWLALYLDFTPVGETYIAGVQARYYLPLLYLGAIAWMNKRVKIKMNYYSFVRFIAIAVNILWVKSIGDLVLKNRLL